MTKAPAPSMQDSGYKDKVTSNLMKIWKDEQVKDPARSKKANRLWKSLQVRTSTVGIGWGVGLDGGRVSGLP